MKFPLLRASLVRRIRPRFVLIAAAAAGMLGVLCFVALAGGNGTRAVRVGHRRIRRVVHAEARIEPVRPVVRLATTGGLLNRVLVEEGGSVEAGATIIEFDVEEATAQLALARAELTVAQAAERRVLRGAPAAERQRQRALLSEAEAAREAARVERERAEALWASKAITEQAREAAVRSDGAAAAQLEAARRGFELLLGGARAEDLAAASAQSDAARARVALAEMALRRRRLTAPFGGVVLSLLAHAGEAVPPLSPVVVFADLSALQARAEVDEMNMSAVRPGQRACAHIDSLPGAEFCGQVTSRGGSLGRRHFDPDDPRSARSDLKVVEVTSSLPSDPRLVSGLGAELVIEIEDRGEVLSVPVAAVRRVRDVTRVRVRAASGRRVEREVRLGQSDGTYYEVLSGLDDGDRVIVGP